MWDWFPFPRIKVFTSRNKAAKYYRTKTDDEIEQFDKSAETHYLSCDTGEDKDIALVIFDGAKFEDMDFSQRMALVAHECSHIVDYTEEKMAAKLDGETRAYMHQSAMLAVLNQLGVEWFK